MVMYDPDKPDQKKGVENCVNAMMDNALEMDGTVSVSPTHPEAWCVATDVTIQGEHGIGLGKKVSIYVDDMGCPADADA